MSPPLPYSASSRFLWGPFLSSQCIVVTHRWFLVLLCAGEVGEHLLCVGALCMAVGLRG